MNLFYFFAFSPDTTLTSNRALPRDPWDSSQNNMPDTYCDILQRGIDDLIVVRKAVKLESVEVEEDVVAELDAVDVGMRLQAPACGKGGRAVRVRTKRNRSSLLLSITLCKTC